MKYTIVILLCLSFATHAQEQRSSDTEINARVQAYLKAEAAAQSAIKQSLTADIGALTDALDKAQKELAALKVQCPAPVKP